MNVVMLEGIWYVCGMNGPSSEDERDGPLIPCQGRGRTQHASAHGELADSRGGEHRSKTKLPVGIGLRVLA